MILGYDEILNRIKNKCEEKNYSFIKFINFDNIKSSFIIKCNKDNYEWKTKYINFVYKNGGCHKCARNIPYTKEEITNKILEKCKLKNYTLIETYNFKGNKTKIKLKCNNDNHEWMTDYHQFINGNFGCKKCYGNLPLSKDQYMKNICNKCKEKNYLFLSLDNWIGNKTKMKLRCLTDNNEWKIRYDSFITNNIGCPKCAAKTKYVEPFEKKLNTLNIKYSKEKTFENLKNIGLLKFDYFLIEKQILIELDGAEHKNTNSRTYFTDKLKNEFCEKNNLKLIRIENKYIKNINIENILKIN